MVSGVVPRCHVHAMHACMHAHMNDSCAIRLCHDWSQLPALAFVFQSSGNLFNMFMHVHMKVLYI